MEWIIVLCIVVSDIIIGLFIKNFFPSYMGKKGENIATKEDIAEITRRQDEVEQEFKEKFEIFTSDLHFRNDFNFKQYRELYCVVYGYVVQSEYTRELIKLSTGVLHSFEEIPFLSITQTRTTSKSNVETVVENIESGVTQFTITNLCDFVIDNAQYATPELLKDTVSFRTVSGNRDAVSEKEQIRLQMRIVKSIIVTYNQLRKELKMDFDEKEINEQQLNLEM